MNSLQESGQKSIPAVAHWRSFCSLEQYAQRPWDRRYAANNGGAWAQAPGKAGIVVAHEDDAHDRAAEDVHHGFVVADNVGAAAVT